MTIAAEFDSQADIGSGVFPSAEEDIADDTRPAVTTGMDVHRVLEDLDAALGHPVMGDPLMFQRSNELVIVVGASTTETVRVAPGTQILRPLVSPALLPRITQYVNFQRPVKPDKAEVTCAKLEGRKEQWRAARCVPPPIVLSSFLAKPSWRYIRPIRGIAGCPFLRADGSIVQVPGYDSATGYLYSPSMDFGPVPACPTQEDARIALAELREVFCDFPYVTEADKMVPIAAAMTVIARPGLSGAIPAFIFDASTRGSGKTLQCDVVSAIATGREAERQSFPDDDTELEKTLCSYAIAGVPILLLDNVTRAFGGGPLDKVITAKGNVSFRKLGGNEIRAVPWTSTIMASGNGIAFHEDTARRVLVARLESPLEDPESREEREFAHPNLVAWVLENRARLVVDVLTILRAYAIKNFPDAGCARWGSFEEWSRLIPHAIVFAGGADLMSARPTVDSGGGSLDTEHLEIVLDGIYYIFGKEYASAQEIVRKLFGSEYSKDDKLDSAREAVRSVTRCRADKDVDTAAFGYYLRGRRGRVMGGKKLEKQPRVCHKGTTKWRTVSSTTVNNDDSIHEDGGT